jgi:hypothetical protein
MSSASEKEMNSPAETPPSERRRNLRFPFTAAVEATETKSGARIAGRTSDLSLGGCYVDAISPFPVGTEAKVTITRGKESFEVQARVVYSQIGMGMGLAFVSAQPKQVRLFQRWLMEISGKIAPQPEPPDGEEPKEASGGGLQNESNYVLSELLIALMRKGVLSETEGKTLLKKLLK